MLKGLYKLVTRNQTVLYLVMIAISDAPILLAHWHWRCAERKLYTGMREDAMVELKTAIRELEKAMQLSQDSCTRSCIQKQIEFHERRIDLLATCNSTVRTDVHNLLSEEGNAFPQVFEDIVAVSIEEEKEIETELSVPEVEAENILLPSVQDLEPVSDSRSVIEPCLSENEQIKAFVCRIAELENENKALKESLQMEQSENNSLKQSIKELK